MKDAYFLLSHHNNAPAKAKEAIIGFKPAFIQQEVWAAAKAL